MIEAAGELLVGLLEAIDFGTWFGTRPPRVGYRYRVRRQIEAPGRVLPTSGDVAALWPSPARHHHPNREGAGPGAHGRGRPVEGSLNGVVPQAHHAAALSAGYCRGAEIAAAVALQTRFQRREAERRDDRSRRNRCLVSAASNVDIDDGSSPDFEEYIDGDDTTDPGIQPSHGRRLLLDRGRQTRLGSSRRGARQDGPQLDAGNRHDSVWPTDLRAIRELLAARARRFAHGPGSPRRRRRTEGMRAMATWINDANKIVFSRTRTGVNWKNSRLVPSSTRAKSRQ